MSLGGGRTEGGLKCRKCLPGNKETATEVLLHTSLCHFVPVELAKYQDG